MLDPRMVELIKNAYVRRLQENRPPIGEPKVHEIVRSMPLPPQWLVRRLLAESMHLPEQERMQQVAELIVVKHLLPGQ